MNFNFILCSISEIITPPTEPKEPEHIFKFHVLVSDKAVS